MEEFMNSEAAVRMREIRLPRYRELPQMELYQEQVLMVLQQILQPLLGEEGQLVITSAMLSNYIQLEVISKPVKKKYNRRQLAYLVFLCTCKQVMSLNDICRLLKVQSVTYPLEIAYNYFCTELENAIHTAFGSEPVPDTATVRTQETLLIGACVNAIAYKVYLNRFLESSYDPEESLRQRRRLPKEQQMMPREDGFEAAKN